MNLDGDNRGNGNEDSWDGSDSAQLQELARDKTNTARETPRKRERRERERKGERERSRKASRVTEYIYIPFI